MRKTGFILLLMISLIQACSDKNRLPDGVLDQPKMKDVMWDMIRAGDFLNNYVFYREVNVDKAAESQKWNEKVFAMHKITRKQFDVSYDYYQQHPLLMKAIMDSIGKIKVEQTVTKPVTDSTAAAIDTINAIKKMDTIRKKIDSIKVNRLQRLRNIKQGKPAVI
jgi:hypothetical protein